MKAATLLAAAAALALAGCNRNTAPGNDAEAQLDHAPTPAPTMAASAALSGIATEAVTIETMNDADVASLGGLEGKCSVRLTAVAFPSFLYDSPRGTGYVKLNAKLIPLAAQGGGLFADGDLRVVVRPVEEAFGDDGRREAELILMLPGAEDELGYRGYEVCPQAAEPAG